MKVYTFRIKTAGDWAKETNIEELIGAPIATLHSMDSYKQDDLTSVVTVAVTLGEVEAEKEA